MEIRTIAEFLDYYSRLRERTRKVVECIPEQHINWTYRPGKFTMGDLVRHIAAIERWLYAETVLGLPPRYTGCGPEIALDFEHPLAYMDAMHNASVEIFGQIDESRLSQKIQTPAGRPITCWKWLRALCEHEIHHRGQIYLYLNILEINTPPLFGLTSEEIIQSRRS